MTGILLAREPEETSNATTERRRDEYLAFLSTQPLPVFVSDAPKLLSHTVPPRHDLRFPTDDFKRRNAKKGGIRDLLPPKIKVGAFKRRFSAERAVRRYIKMAKLCCDDDVSSQPAIS
ncbi:uncharacterized protein EKO05_0010854 [Ascochyta rabiei]|uniref:Uncharacterized protein n=1 Tax=Didymella rabiei TaxID=5454 RepID=A0A162ZTK1_DIDRA|nr:uncharacterized protein EKO05_0010854 [Ascochyta rabiei]KZM20797.1 hypothetical protein ST47_g8067 [Ascochyta rabiei]UPX20626.1 hypothetical protein EKO05_0010854 [Ascochyta rabiei]